MMVRTPNYRLTEELSIQSRKGGYSDPVTLPAGTFVRPIHIDYVPKHVINDKRWEYFNPNTDVFAYTSIGIVMIPKNIMRET